MTFYEFPSSFQWGAATAAAQIEGASSADGKGPSIWDTMCQEPGAIIDGSTIDTACDHYHRLDDDVNLMVKLGLKTYRFSISWARVMPDGRTINPHGLDFYRELINTLHANGITPWVTLYHWDLPQPLQDHGGWTNRETAEAFANYATYVFKELGHNVNNWTTLNEPWCSSLLSYACGEHAPGHTSPHEAVAAVHHLLLAHGMATSKLRELRPSVNPEAQFGITLNFSTVHPADPSNPGDQDAARRIDGLANRLFLGPIFYGNYPSDVVDDMSAQADIRQFIHDGDLDTIAVPIDMLGVNFYNGQMVQHADPADDSPLVFTNDRGRKRRSPNVGSERIRHVSRGLPLTDMGWEVNAQDLYLLLTRLHREYTGPNGADIPLIITENGAAYPDTPDEKGFVDDSMDRQTYIRDHLIAVHQAIAEGAQVNGYLVWSLMDNFEWAFGYTKRFGIVRVNYETQERIPKASALWYRDVIKQGGFTA